MPKVDRICRPLPDAGVVDWVGRVEDLPALVPIIQMCRRAVGKHIAIYVGGDGIDILAPGASRLDDVAGVAVIPHARRPLHLDLHALVLRPRIPRTAQAAESAT